MQKKLIMKCKNYKQQIKEVFRDLVTVKTLSIFTISITPILFYLDLIISKLGINKFDLGVFSFDANYFNSFDIFIWVLMQKTIPALLIIIWLFNSKDKWLNILFLPLSIYIFQIISIFKDEEYIIDLPIYVIILIEIPLVLFLHLYRKKMILNKNLILQKLETGDLIAKTYEIVTSNEER